MSATSSIEWTEVPGWPGIAASRDGRVRGRSGRVLKPYATNTGHRYVLIPQPGGRGTPGRKLWLHHAVLLAFVGPALKDRKGGTWTTTAATGCDRISPGCDNCYALTLAKRLKAMGSAKYQTDGDPRTSGPGFGVAIHSEALTEPLHWRKPRKVFVNSMSDLFHARVSREFVARVFAVMAATPQHTYQILTKRPERMARMLADECTCPSGHAPGIHFRSLMEWAATSHSPTYVPGLTHGQFHRTSWPLPNVWLGTSIESDEYVKRADALRAAPAAVRFISAEPLLGPLPSLDLGCIDWLIAGGESGPGARPVDPAWIRDLRDRCQASGTAFFFKQWGGRTPKAGGRELDGRTWDEYPAGAA